MTIDECFEHYKETGNSEFDTYYKGEYTYIILDVTSISAGIYTVVVVQGVLPEEGWEGWARY